MSSILYFNIPASGHINPSLAVVTELVLRGERVLYVNHEDVRSTISATGAEFIPYPATPLLNRLAFEATSTYGGSIPANALALLEMNEFLIPFALDLIDQHRPNRIVFDSLAGWGKYAAQIRGRKAIAAVTTFVIDPRTANVGLGTALKMGLEFVSLMPRYLRIRRRMLERFGLQIGGPLSAVMNLGDLNLVFTSASFQPASGRFDSTFQFVGPSISSRPDGSGFPFDLLTQQPLVYISLGTIHNQNLEFYQTCFRAFADHPGQFVLSVGKRTDIQSLGEIPANFIVRNFVPQLNILERADVFITHGGLNSAHEGLWHGVPLIAIPQQAEQLIVARQIADSNAGISLGLGSVTARQLRDALDGILADLPQFQAAARRAGTALRNAGGYERAVDLIQAFI